MQEAYIPYDSARGDWNGSMITLAEAIKAQLGPVDALFVNAGIWESIIGFQDVESAVQQLRALIGTVKGGRNPIWMTTTANRNRVFKSPPTGTNEDIGYLAARQLGFHVLDRYGISASLGYFLDSRSLPKSLAWIDNVHFRPYVSQQFNNALLNMLCAVY